MKLGSVRLFVRDLAAALPFYQQQLRLTLKAGGPAAGFCLFDAGALDLLLEAVPPDAPEDEQQLVGRFTGLSFSVEDIQAQHAALLAAGVAFIEAPERQAWGGWLATFKDPAGNALQLVQYPV
ncbi:MAG: glyoxalase/bleomycin resistance/dioxygenase family protein [Methylibium sp.]|nr:glyoxalase/bleomycin resistance/dioxygenase family protein [Methylibium sp.]